MNRDPDIYLQGYIRMEIYTDNEYGVSACDVSEYLIRRVRDDGRHSKSFEPATSDQASGMLRLLLVHPRGRTTNARRDLTRTRFAVTIMLGL
jgi:hypothetical protein